MSHPAIREAIERTSAAIAASKATARNVPATARLSGGLKFDVTGPNGERLSTDMAPAMGGAASGPSPAWLLRGALASRGRLGLDDGVSAGLSAVRMRVRIGGDARPEVLRELVAWADTHSPVGCTVRQASSTAVDIEVV